MLKILRNFIFLKTFLQKFLVIPIALPIIHLRVNAMASSSGSEPVLEMKADTQKWLGSNGSHEYNGNESILPIKTRKESPALAGLFLCIEIHARELDLRTKVAWA